MIVFAKRSIEPDFPHQYRGLLPQLHRVYLDELSIDPQQAIGVNITELAIANEDVAIELYQIFSDLILYKSKKTEIF